MQKRMHAIVLAAGLAALAAQPILAADGHAMHGAGHGDHGMAHAGAIAATGEVRSINAKAGKIKMKHDPIPALGWPVMVMDFRVADRKLLDGLKAGDRVSFTLEQAAAGYDIAAVSKTGQ